MNFGKFESFFKKKLTKDNRLEKVSGHKWLVFLSLFLVATGKIIGQTTEDNPIHPDELEKTIKTVKNGLKVNGTPENYPNAFYGKGPRENMANTVFSYTLGDEINTKEWNMPNDSNTVEREPLSFTVLDKDEKGILIIQEVIGPKDPNLAIGKDNYRKYAIIIGDINGDGKINLEQNSSESGDFVGLYDIDELIQKHNFDEVDIEKGVKLRQEALELYKLYKTAAAKWRLDHVEDGYFKVSMNNMGVAFLSDSDIAMLQEKGWNLEQIEELAQKNYQNILKKLCTFF